MVLDGYGLNDRTEGNAIALANTPVMDKLMKECPFVKGQASGLAVGLPDGQIPLKKMGRPEDVAQAVLFLAGDASDYITGQVLCVDGGMAM